MRCITNSLAVSLVWLLLWPTAAWGTKPYKIYVINKYGAYDIVCDSYTVKKNDHIWDILRRRGSIAEQDFPRFVQMLRDMNPGIQDVNKIYPRQKILIPLKEMPARESHMEAGPRYVTIPMIPDVLYKSHEVNSGECLSKIITAHLQVRWDQLTSAYLATFRRLNPRIADLNLIYPGQTLRIPELSSLEMPETETAAVASPEDHEDHEDQGIQEAGPGEVQTEGGSEESLVVSSNQMPAASDGVANPDDIMSPAETIAVLPEEPIVASERPKADPEAQQAPFGGPVAQRSQDQTAAGTEQRQTMGAEPEQPPPPMEVATLDTEKLSVQEFKSSDVLKKDIDDTLGSNAVPSSEVPKSSAVAPSDQVGSGVERARIPAEVLSKDGVDIITSDQTAGVPEWQRIVSMVTTQIGGKLLSSGHCYFPGKHQRDVALDLAAFPVIELQQGQHVLFEKTGRLPQNAEETIRASWKGLLVVRADMEEAGRVVLEKVFRAVYGEHVRKKWVLPSLDDGIQVTLRGDWIFSEEQSRGRHSPYYCITLMDSQEEGTSPAVIEYLELQKIRVVDILTGEKRDKPAPLFHDGQSLTASPLALDGSSAETFVAGLATALGYLYETQIPLSFEYAGFQVETTANIIYSGDGLDVVVDFGTFYGDAKAAIVAGGMNVLSIDPEAGLHAIAESVLNALGVVYTKDPVFYAADRELSKTLSLAVPGYLISYGQGGKMLLPRKNLHEKIFAFLHAQQIGVFEIKTML